MNIKKKLIAIALVCAMAVSFSACSDKKDGTTGGNAVANVTLSSEEIQSLQKQELTIKPYNASSDNAQDPVENSDGAVDNNNSSADNQSGDNSSANNSNDDTSSSLSGEDLLNPTDVIIMTDNNNSDSDSNSDSGNSSDDSGSGDDSSSETPAGKKEIMQAWWMDLTKKSDFVFDGEFITAQFKIKDTTANGTYPVTIEWTDFSNWNAQSVKFSTTDGAVVVGSEATENSFKNDGSAEIMATNVSGNPGDTVTVSFNMKNNPGIVAVSYTHLDVYKRQYW